MQFIDTNHSFGRWPWSDSGSESATELAELLNKEGIEEAWVASCASLLAADLEATEKRLEKNLAPLNNIRLVRTINPVVAGAKKLLDAALADPRTVAIRLVPTLHHYKPFDERVISLCAMLADKGPMPVQILLRFDDERHRLPGLNTMTISPLDILCLTNRFPSLCFVVQGAVLSEANALAGKRHLERDQENVWLDTSFLDFMDTLAHAAGNLSTNRMLFGTAEPFLYARSNILHFHSPTLAEAEREKIAWQNAKTLAARRA